MAAKRDWRPGGLCARSMPLICWKLDTGILLHATKRIALDLDFLLLYGLWLYTCLYWHSVVSPTVISPLRNESLFYNCNYKHSKIGVDNRVKVFFYFKNKPWILPQEFATERNSDKNAELRDNSIRHRVTIILSNSGWTYKPVCSVPCRMFL